MNTVMRTLYFRQQIDLWQDRILTIKMDQIEHTPKGEFLARIYYQSHLLDIFRDSIGETFGFPHNGGYHTLTLRAFNAYAFIDFIKVLKLYKVSVHREEGKRLFIEELERKFYDQVY